MLQLPLHTLKKLLCTFKIYYQPPSPNVSSTARLWWLTSPSLRRDTPRRRSRQRQNRLRPGKKPGPTSLSGGQGCCCLHYRLSSRLSFRLGGVGLHWWYGELEAPTQRLYCPRLRSTKEWWWFGASPKISLHRCRPRPRPASFTRTKTLDPILQGTKAHHCMVCVLCMLYVICYVVCCMLYIICFVLYVVCCMLCVVIVCHNYWWPVKGEGVILQSWPLPTLQASCI